MKEKKLSIMTVFFVTVLILFPMRHVYWGGDLWDIGYNYANFRYAGIGNIGEMWFFSTFLSNKLGHLLTFLPMGHTVLGLNLYTGFLVSALAVIGYWFCTDKIGMPKPVVFAGELLAESFCWCPTALLYNYLTYLLLLVCMILLYLGLIREKTWNLFWAGVCLGLNIFVRFSNLPEMRLIVAVWAYAFLKSFDERKNGQKDGQKDGQKNRLKKALASAGGYTLWCLAGYLAALAVMFTWIQLRYGIGAYVEGIRLLFGMTETAADYNPSQLLYGVYYYFKEGLFWVKHVGFFVVASSLLGFSAGYAHLCCKKKQEEWSRFFSALSIVGSVLISAVLVCWLYLKKTEPRFTSFNYTSYDPIRWPGTMLLSLALFMACVNFLRPKADRKDRLLGVLVAPAILLVSLGSNNDIMPSMNNLFLTAPYVIWQGYRFTRFAWDRGKKKVESFGDFRFDFRPSAISLWAFLAVCSAQILIFGLKFSFCEATGIKETGSFIHNNEVLSGISMSSEREQILGTISEFANQKDLKGKEVILFGQIPALSFYLEMPPAFHAWCDLESFGYETMKETMEKLENEIESGHRALPVVIAGCEMVNEIQMEMQSEEPGTKWQRLNSKWSLITEFMEKLGYQRRFLGDKFEVFFPGIEEQ